MLHFGTDITTRVAAYLNLRISGTDSENSLFTLWITEAPITNIG
jgi:hypothetical protein